MHSTVEKDDGPELPDSVNAYGRLVLELGMLFIQLEDLTREGDGERNNILWKIMMFYFRATGHHMYALLALIRNYQVSTLLSPRMSAHLTWSQFCSA